MFPCIISNSVAVAKILCEDFCFQFQIIITPIGWNLFISLRLLSKKILPFVFNKKNRLFIKCVMKTIMRTIFYGLLCSLYKSK